LIVFDRRRATPRDFRSCADPGGGRDAIRDANVAAGAIAIGKCGAYGQAYDFAGEAAARAAALKQCKGDCTAVTMKRACAALAIDMTNPCGAHGYAVKPHIRARSIPRPASATNSAARNASSRLGLRRQG